MCIKSQVILLLSVSLLVQVSSESVSDTLEVIVTNTKLPSARAYINTGYDGDDTIYLWGGLDLYFYYHDILKYSISKQTIENNGIIPNRVFGSGCWIGNNNFVHIGGRSVPGNSYYSDVWNFDTSDPNNWTSVTNIPRDMDLSNSIWDEGDNTYTIGGSNGIYTFDTILRYSRTTQTVLNVGTLPKSMRMPSAVWDSTTGSAYIFGGETDTGYLKDILKFDAADGRVTNLSVTLPEGIAFASAIWNGMEAYIIGGASYPVVPPPIVRFNPTTNEVTSVPVNNFPTQLENTGCVYVEKLKRIYIFGGHAEGRYRNEIMYIDLNDSGTPLTTTEDSTTEGTPTTEPTTEPTTKPTTDPTTEPTTQPTAEPSTAATTLPTTEPQTEPTTTKSPIDFECPTETGLYADPKNCRGFYNCDAWYPYHFCCPLPLFYNPSNKRCDFQDMVECHNDPGLPCDSPPGKLDTCE